MGNIDLTRILIRNCIIESLLNEEFFSTTTANSAEPIAYSTPKKEKQKINVEESPRQKANKLGLIYSDLMDGLSDKELNLVKNIFDEFKKKGTLNLEWSPEWHKNKIYPYLFEIIAQEAKSGNEKAALLIEKIFNPLNSKKIIPSLVSMFNRRRKPDENGQINDLITDAYSEDVMRVINNISKYRIPLNIIENYKGNNYFLAFIINRLQLRFSSEYPKLLIRKNAGPPKIPSSYSNTYDISDIQKYLYYGNSEDEINNNFIAFNKANKEIIDYFKQNKINQKYTAIIDGVFNSKLDTEEMVDVYPHIFKTKTNVSNAFSFLVKTEKLSKYINDIYKKYNLNLPPIESWSMKDISSSQDPVRKLKGDNFNNLYETIKVILNNKNN